MRPSARVLWASGACGFGLGVTGYATWQAAVESGQVVAGLVVYPPGNPFYLYHAKLWTIANQACALLLHVGLSEIAISTLVSGVLGMLSFQALSAVVLAFSGEEAIAVATPFLVLVSAAAEPGLAYPVRLMGTTHTYGVLGLSIALLAPALIACGERKLGGLLVGMVPAVHPSLGLWLFIVMAIAVAWDIRNARDSTRSLAGHVLLGAGLSVTSLALHLLLTYPRASVDPGLARQYLAAFVRYWDAHRFPVDLHNPGVYLNLGVLLGGLLALRLFRNDLTSPALFLLRTLSVWAMLGLASIALSRLPPEAVPASMLVLMPTRLLNLNVLAAAAALIGLLARHRHSPWAQAGLVGVLTGLLAGRGSVSWVFARRLTGAAAPQAGPSPVLVMALGGAALLVAGWTSRNEGARDSLAGRNARLLTGLRKVESLLFVAAAAMAVVLSLYHWTGRSLVFRDRTNQPLLAETARGKGMLLTGANLHLVQLRTRRPVLIDGGGLDMLPYALEGGPALERILKQVYGVSLLAPPAGHPAAMIPRLPNKAVWERRTAEEWARIGGDFGVTEVLTYADWTLDLPLIGRDAECALYRIPAASGPPGGTR